MAAKLTNSLCRGVRIAQLKKSSILYSIGMRTGDTILTVNGNCIEDDLDFNFYSAAEELIINCLHNHTVRTYTVYRQPGEILDLELEQRKVKQCQNRCLFCFIDQLPKGLRKSLYVKDEDYRYSFLHGNYITLTSLTEKELKRIINLRLSPLYISVHATDTSIRKKMIKHRNAGKIMAQLQSLEKNNLSFHSQIVICPGFNDNRILDKTIADLLGFTNSLLSLAIVPVGLTKFSNPSLCSVNASMALTICEQVAKWSIKDKRIQGFRRVFVADELFIKAGLPIPANTYYEDYPQIENGVGLVRMLLDEWKREKRKVKKYLLQSAYLDHSKRNRQKKYGIITSLSAECYLRGIVNEINQLFSGFHLDILPITNHFFGETVTVAGLITGKDIIRHLKKKPFIGDVLIVPKIIFNYNNYTLDGFSIERIARHLGKKFIVIDTITQLITFLKAQYNV